MIDMSDRDETGFQRRKKASIIGNDYDHHSSNHKVSAPEQKRPLSGVKELVSSFTPQSTGTHFRHLYVSGAVAMPAYIVIRLGRAAGGQPGTTSQLGVN